MTKLVSIRDAKIHVSALVEATVFAEYKITLQIVNVRQDTQEIVLKDASESLKYLKIIHLVILAIHLLAAKMPFVKTMVSADAVLNIEVILTTNAVQNVC
jgi:hypothetical protein